MKLANSYIQKITKIVKKIKKKDKYPLHEPLLDESDIFQLKKCIKSTYISTVSKYVQLFEKNISRFTKSKYTVATNTGTAAIEIALRSIGVKKNDEVLIPNLNYIASANCTLQVGAIPHFVDIDKNNLGININKLDSYLKKISYIKNKKLINKKTKRTIRAIVPTHIFGNACEIKKIVKISKKFKLKVIEDSSEALGSFFDGKHLGTIGDIGILSFNGNKIISTGAGGALITNNKQIYKKAMLLSKISRKNKSYWEYDYSELGYNYRMSGINAALGISQLKKIKKILKNKIIINKFYNNNFSKFDNIKLIQQTKKSKWNFWLNNIVIRNISLGMRNKIIVGLNKNNILARPVWKLMHKIDHLKKFPKMQIENSIMLEKSLISLPSSPSLLNK